MSKIPHLQARIKILRSLLRICFYFSLSNPNQQVAVEDFVFHAGSIICAHLVPKAVPH